MKWIHLAAGVGNLLLAVAAVAAVLSRDHYRFK
jgi:hypothetical protein